MNEFSIGNIFRVENRNPKYAIPYFTCDYLVNAVCLAYEMPWEKTFKLLYKQAHKLCRMPSDNKCMKAMMNELHFFHLPNQNICTLSMRIRKITALETVW